MISLFHIKFGFIYWSKPTRIIAKARKKAPRVAKSKGRWLILASSHLAAKKVNGVTLADYKAF